jgi:hypothetical protein
MHKETAEQELQAVLRACLTISQRARPPARFEEMERLLSNRAEACCRQPGWVAAAFTLAVPRATIIEMVEDFGFVLPRLPLGDAG